MFSVIIKDFKSFFRNGINLFFNIFFPTLLVFILGTFLQNMDVSDDNVGEITVHYYDFGLNPAYSNGLEGFLKELDSGGTITYVKSDDLADSLNKTDKDEITCVVELEGENITLHTGSNGTKNRTIELLLNGFNRTSGSYVSAAAVNPTAISKLAQINTEETAEEYTVEKDLGVNRSMMDYYAVSMIVMMLFMTNAIGSAETLGEEKKLKTQARLETVPVSRIKIYLGKLIGTIPLSVVQIVTVMFASVFMLGASYCADWQGNLLLGLMFFSVSLAIISLAMLLSQIIKVSLIGIITPISWLMLFISGTFAKPIHIEGLSDKMPPYIIQKVSFDLTVFGNSEGALQTIVVSACIFIVCLILGILLYSKKGRYAK